MQGFLKLRWWLGLIIYIVLDVIAVGMGMGVPIFCIVLGFPVGWYLARRHLLLQPELEHVFRDVLRDSLITSGVTFIFMAVLWGRTVPMLFDPAADFANLGIPMIVYEPKASFAGWLILMIFISPFLELLTTIFSAYLTIPRQIKADQR